MSPRCRNCSPVPSELRAAAGLLERRWTMATIYACSSGAARFNEFRQSLPGVSPTTLSERLEQLEAAGIVERQMIAGRPPHTEYTLTRRGRRLALAVAGLLEPASQVAGGAGGAGGTAGTGAGGSSRPGAAVPSNPRRRK
jgi:DNA-binding HxlR family transcriptional regulator